MRRHAIHDPLQSTRVPLRLSGFHPDFSGGHGHAFLEELGISLGVVRQTVALWRIDVVLERARLSVPKLGYRRLRPDELRPAGYHWRVVRADERAAGHIPNPLKTFARARVAGEDKTRDRTAGRRWW